jgi:DNA-directed RNA polymerase specialized sigma24 family protein
MSSDNSVSCWIGQVKVGERAAAQPLWQRYFERLVGLARKKLQGSPRRAADEEDVALSAFDSFCRGAERGRFPQLADRHDLWRVLVVITAGKALDLRRREFTLKRGGGAVRGESALLGPADAAPEEAGFEQVIGNEPTPAFAAEVAETCRHLFAQLDDPALCLLALLKMEGYTNEEIARHLDCGQSTVERRLRLIRNTWEKEGSR